MSNLSDAYYAFTRTPILEEKREKKKSSISSGDIEQVGVAGNRTREILRTVLRIRVSDLSTVPTVLFMLLVF